MNKNEFTMCLIAIIVVIYIHDNYYLSVKTKSRENFADSMNLPSWLYILMGVSTLLTCVISLLSGG